LSLFLSVEAPAFSHRQHHLGATKRSNPTSRYEYACNAIDCGVNRPGATVS
jgi:hypothetical protein